MKTFDARGRQDRPHPGQPRARAHGLRRRRGRDLRQGRHGHAQALTAGPTVTICSGSTGPPQCGGGVSPDAPSSASSSPCVVARPSGARPPPPLAASTGDVAHDDGLQWGLDRIGALQAWNVARGAGITIAVIDCGVALEHEDLRDKLVTGTACKDTAGDPASCAGRPGRRRPRHSRRGRRGRRDRQRGRHRRRGARGSDHADQGALQGVRQLSVGRQRRRRHRRRSAGRPTRARTSSTSRSARPRDGVRSRVRRRGALCLGPRGDPRGGGREPVRAHRRLR